MAGPGKVTVDVEFAVRINGEPYTGPLAVPLVVGPDDVLVLNLGPRASLTEVDRARRVVRERVPDLEPRVLFVGAEDVAVVRRDEAEDIPPRDLIQDT